jgi:hypothetical protein
MAEHVPAVKVRAAVGCSCTRSMGCSRSVSRMARWRGSCRIRFKTSWPASGVVPYSCLLVLGQCSALLCHAV